MLEETVMKAKGSTGTDKGDAGTIFVRLAALFVLAMICAVISHANSAGLEVSRTEITAPNLPDELNGLRIAQISDLHSSGFGEGQSELIRAVTDFKPDLIAITGDFIDGIWPEAAPCEELVSGLRGIAPIYWVRGNHEYYLDDGDRAAFEADMALRGAVLLDNSAVALKRNGVAYLLSGMNDVSELRDDPRKGSVPDEVLAMEYAHDFMRVLDSRTPPGDFPLKLMLCHQPHYWQLWADDGYDVTLSGHLHGWMIRLPGIGGLFRRPSRYFPAEDAGLYNKDGMAIYISRGLDARLSYRNFRMNDKPELALLEITNRQ